MSAHATVDSPEDARLVHAPDAPCGDVGPFDWVLASYPDPDGVVEVTCLACACAHGQQWVKVRPIAGGNTDVWRCTDETCGALARADRLVGHRADFHDEEGQP